MKSYSNEALKQPDTLRSLFLTKIILDRQPGLVLTSPEAARSGLILPGNQFFLIKLEYLDQFDSVLDAENDPLRRYTYGELLTKTELIFLQYLVNEDFTSFSTLLDENLFFLVCLNQPVDKKSSAAMGRLLAHLEEEFEQARQELWSTLRMRVQLWATELIEGVESLRWEYENMRWDLTQVANKPLMYPSDVMPQIESPTGKVGRQMKTLEQQVIQHAINQDFVSCESAFQQLISLEEAIYPARNHIADRSTERLLEIYAVSGTPFNSQDPSSISSHVWRKSMYYALTIDDVRAIVKEVLYACQEYFKPSVPPISMRVSEIVEFVDQHLFDAGLCTDVICEHFGISLSYLSRIFKEYQDVKLIDYIHMKRIEASETLLLEQPGLSIQLVAERVGYNSALTYTRAFKRIKGMTPGSYRRTRKEPERYGNK